MIRYSKHCLSSPFSDIYLTFSGSHTQQIPQSKRWIHCPIWKWLVVVMVTTHYHHYKRKKYSYIPFHLFYFIYLLIIYMPSPLSPSISIYKYMYIFCGGFLLVHNLSMQYLLTFIPRLHTPYLTLHLFLNLT